MSEVAAKAGVSQATVSFVLAGRADYFKISSRTRERVLSVVREMGYQRNHLARAMITGKSRILGVLTSPDFGGNITRVLAGAVEATSAGDYLLKVIHHSLNAVDDATITRCLEWRLAGAMVIGLSESSNQLVSEEFAANRLPIAMIDNAPAPKWGIRVRSNDEQGIRLAVSHLVSLGHRRIALLGGAAGHLSTWRESIFRTAISEHGLSAIEHWIRPSAWNDQDKIEAAVCALFSESRSHLPTAIVCSSDTIAMVVQRIARSLGLRLPEELSITGYSNADLSAFADPSLTSVDQSFFDMGYTAAQHLMHEAQQNMSEKLENDFESNSSREQKSNTMLSDFLISTQLIVRKSTTFAPSYTV